MPTLAALNESQHEVVGVITRPAARQGRSSKLIDSPVAVFARENDLPLLETSKPAEPEALDWVQALDADLGVVVAYGAILRQPVLDATKMGWVNLHFSKLPDLRGAAPVQRAILRGDRTLGTTVFLLDAGMDSGPLISVECNRMDEDTTSGDALARLAVLGAPQVLDAVAALETGVEPVPQDTGVDGDAITLAPKLSREDGFVDFCEDASRVGNRVRAVTPAPGAWTLDAAGKGLKLRSVRPAEDAGLPPGALVLEKHRLLVGCADGGAVEVAEVAPAGKSWMNAADWARGQRLGPDARLGRDPHAADDPATDREGQR